MVIYPWQADFPKWRQDLTNPINSLSDVDRIRNMLVANPRDLLLFDLATQTGCKLNQALRLKIEDLKHCQVGEPIAAQQIDYDDGSNLRMTLRLFESFNRYVRIAGPSENDHIFKSRKGNNALSLTSASRLINSWFKKVGLEGLSGFSSLKKTYEVYFSDNRKEMDKQASRSIQSVLTPVSTKTRQEKVYHKLQQAILHGTIPPGARLINEQIAKQMEVSDTPVREALARLRAEGLVTRSDHKGYVVHQLTPEDLDEIVRIRVNLECMAAKEACRKISEAEINLLVKLQVPEGEINRNIKGFFTFNKLFHQTIYKAAKMPTLLSIIENLMDKMSPYFNLLAKEIAEEDPHLTWDRHAHIIDGLKRRDQDYVCKWIAADIKEFASQIILKMSLLTLPRHL